MNFNRKATGRSRDPLNWPCYIFIYLFIVLTLANRFAKIW